MEENGHGSFESNIPTFICSVRGQKTHTHKAREPGSPIETWTTCLLNESHLAYQLGWNNSSNLGVRLET